MSKDLVLIADDYADAREMYGAYLEHLGYRVAAAADGREAVAKAKDLQPSVILMDLSMPFLDGYQAARMLKSDPTTSTIPVVAMTGHSRGDARVEACTTVCESLLSKPVLPDAVANEILRVLRKKPS